MHVCANGDVCMRAHDLALAPLFIVAVKSWLAAYFAPATLTSSQYVSGNLLPCAFSSRNVYAALATVSDVDRRGPAGRPHKQGHARSLR